MVSEFANKCVVVTGASRGIGRQIATDFGAAGACVVVNFAQAAGEADKAVNEIIDAGGNAVACQADIADAQAVARMFELAHDTYGPVDILVNNAGANRDGAFLDLTEEDWDRVNDVNLKGPFLCSQAGGRQMMAAKRGHIINISAVTAVDARMNAANYCSSKAGLNMLTKCMALELAPHVNVNCLALGFIESPLVREIYSDEQLAGIVGETPLARMGSYGEISGAVQYFASEAASFITGQTLIVDGGRIMR